VKVKGACYSSGNEFLSNRGTLRAMKTCPECDESRRFPNEQAHCDVHGLLLTEGEGLEPFLNFEFT
jgi:hypothetical protein